MSLADDLDELYRILGVAKDATKEQIKKGFRKKASKAHPDKGGSEEEFNMIRTAYMVLIDDEARSRYDKTGSYGANPHGEPTAFQLALQELAGLFQHTLLQNLDNIEHVDIMNTMKVNIRTAKAEQTKHITKQRSRLKKFEKARKRLKRKKELDVDVLDNVIGTQIQGVTRNIEDCERKNESFDLMIEIIDDSYIYDFEQMQQIGGPMFVTTSRGTSSL